MELDTLTVENFRQFYGEQEIKFSRSDEQNVTLINGSNGSGKTTILNAFLWLFYDDITLPKPGEIPSERAVAEAGHGDTITVRVSLTFDHEDHSYTATRTKTYQRTSPSGLSTKIQNEEIEVEFVDKNGNHKRRGNPEDTLRNIMPERLRDIFFFDGETIEKLASMNEQERVQTAIQNIMGLTILERAERHLDEVRKRFQDTASEYGGEQLSDLYDKRTKIEDQLEDRQKELEETKDSKRSTEDELEDVRQRLRELEDSRGLQEERDSLEDDIEELNADIEAIESGIAEQISDNGYVPFAMPAVEETAEMLREKREKGEIPIEIKTHFVDDLLDLEECICGRDLEPGTEPHQQVQQWRERAGSSALEETAMTIAGRLTEIGEGEEELFNAIEEQLERRSQKRDTKQQKSERVTEIGSLLSETETEDIVRLEDRRSKLEDQVGNYEQQIGRLEGSIDDLENELEDLRVEIKDEEEENEKADLARRRAQTAEYLREKVEGLLEQYQNDVRESVNERVNEIFVDIMRKDFYAEIDEDYSLRVLKDVGQEGAIPVAQSRGERQIASLAFISSLVSLARERYESDEDATYFTGGIYPMIMDSPFGALDPEYQQEVSSMMPEVANQVVVLVTQAQWSDEVEGEMDRYTGKSYSLEYHDPEEDDVEYEYTEIVNARGGS